MNFSRIRNIFILAVLLMLFWVLMSGMYDLFHLSLGVIAVVFVIWLDARLFESSFFDEDRETPSLKTWKLFMYIPWLLWQIVLAAIQVAYVILHPRMPIQPSIVRFRTKLPNTTSRVILGNSITLTPGTLTIEIDGDEFTVHSLTDDSSAGILDSSLPDHVGALYMKDAKKILTETKIIRSEDEL